MCSRILLFVAMVLATVCPPVSAIVITDIGTVFSENFDSLASSGSTGTALPASWYLSESGANANASYGVGTGSNNDGNTYSFGATGSTERALGGLQSGSLVPLFGVQLVNATGGLINALTIGYFGEQWRLGAVGRADRLDFQYSTNATSLNNGSWADADGLDFASPIMGGPTGALDGNASANRVALALAITGLSFADGTFMWLRWVDLNATGADDGLAIDDFGVAASRPAGSPGHAVPDTLPTAAALSLVLVGLATTRRRPPVCSCAG